MIERVKPNRHHKHRALKAKQGLVRLEFQVDNKVKARFEQMVEELADEYSEPYDERRRKAKARRELFVKGITQQSVQFAGCEARIEALKAELATVSPNFFKSATQKGRAVPQAIAALPDDAGQLKSLLAEYYQRAVSAEGALHEAKEVARRAVEYRNVQDVKIGELEASIERAGISLPEYDLGNV